MTPAKVRRAVDELLERGDMGDSFAFRPGQREAVEDILTTFLGGAVDTYVLEAPTGSGKSVIATACGLILASWRRTGYIITSDLGLQTQYEADVSGRGIDWGSVRGVDNYLCHVNWQKFSLGECRMRRMSMKRTSQMSCFHACAYYTNRSRAAGSPVAILNYSYWLIQRCYVARKRGDSEDVLFPRRDFAFFDEAHKAVSIVQNHFSPRIFRSSGTKLDELREHMRAEGYTPPAATRADIDATCGRLIDAPDNRAIYLEMVTLQGQLAQYVSAGEKMGASLEDLFGEGEIPPSWRHMMGLVDWVKDVHCKVEDYVDIVRRSGMGTIVREGGGDEATFHCLDEPTIMREHFLAQAGFKVLMSATIGDFSTFCRNAGIKDARCQRMGSGFDFSRSPIIFSPGAKLSFREKDASFPRVMAALDEVMDLHAGQRGVIHTGSYEFTRRILDASRHRRRLIAYEGSREKEAALEELRGVRDGVLIGPSVIEGIDLRGDMSRFQVIFKLPYPSLASPFVKAKMERRPEWYTWTTVISILQGAGRSIRSADDWAVTYILDGCFDQLYAKAGMMFPPEFRSRLRREEITAGWGRKDR